MDLPILNLLLYCFDIAFEDSKHFVRNEAMDVANIHGDEAKDVASIDCFVFAIPRHERLD